MPAPPLDDGNHRVTNAVIQNEIKHLTAEVKAMCDKMDRRMSFLEERHELDVSDLRTRCQETSTQVARLEERQKSTTSILTALNVVIGGIAATIGAVFK